MIAKRPRLRALTTATLNALAACGAGGATCAEVGGRMGLRPREAAARLRWLQVGGLVRYVADTARWQLTDDSLFRQETP